MDIPASILIDQTIRSTFQRASNERIDLFTEYMDLARFPQRDDDQQLAEHYRQKYAGHNIDVVIAVYAGALDFLTKHAERLFPGTPIVFCAIYDKELKKEQRSSRIVGRPANVDMAGTLRLALDLHPGARQVVVVTGAAEMDRHWGELARQDLQAFADQVELQYLIGLPMDELLSRAASLPQTSLLLYLQILKDGNGKAFLPRDALDELSRVARVPIYGLYDTYVGHGIVGGRVVSFEAEGRNAARLALHLLAGEKPETITDLVETTDAYLFDWRQLRRWAIPEDRLPADSALRHYEPPVWEQYRWHIVTVLAVCILQGVLIAGLLIQGARRRKIAAELQQRHEEVVHAARVVTLGELAASLTHELNQPLGAILNNAAAAQLILQHEPVALEDVRDILADIRKDDERASAIIRRMHFLLKKHQVVKQELDLHALIREVVQFVAATAGARKCAIDLELAADLAPVWGDAIHLQQVLLNLLLNGMDAMAECPAANKKLVLRTRRKDRHTLEVTVTDGGAGIAPDQLPRIFERFYTTKREGLGMGLTVARTIIEAHGGGIGVNNNPGGGATFNFTLPLREETSP